VSKAPPTSLSLTIYLPNACGSALSYISVFTTLRERPIYNALIGFSWGTGAILGPVVAGAFSGSSATWRWAFYINLPLAARESLLVL
jgi:MFS family permease